MSGSRFVFLARPVVDVHAEVVGTDVTWMLVSPNARPLGRADHWFPDYESCSAAVPLLRESRDRLRIVISVSRGNWDWRLDLDGIPMAVSSRSYLRQHECDYNVRRFLEAVPAATVMTSIRSIRNGRTLTPEQ